MIFLREQRVRNRIPRDSGTSSYPKKYRISEVGSMVRRGEADTVGGVLESRLNY